MDKHVHAHRQHLETQYGHGLVGMFNNDGTVNKTALATARRGDKKEEPRMVVNVGKQQYDAESAKALALGFAMGLEYDGLKKEGAGSPKFYEQLALSNCFVTTDALTDNLATLWFDIVTMFDSWSDIKIFKVIVHDMTMVMGSLTVHYQ